MTPDQARAKGSGTPLVKANLFRGAIKVAISVGLLWFALTRIDVSDVWPSVYAIFCSPSAALALLVLLLQMPIVAIRQRGIFRNGGVTLSYRDSFGTIFIGAFFGQVLASFLGGDAMRTLRLRALTRSFSVAASGVVVDRIFGILGLVVLTVLASPFIEGTAIPLEQRRILLVVSAVSAIAIAILLFIKPMRFIRAPGKLGKFGADLWSLFQRTADNGALFLAFLANAAAVHLLVVIAIIILGRGADAPLAVADCLVLMPPVMFLAMLPISHSGWGVREGAMVYALSLVGVPASQSLAISITLGLLQLIASLPGLFFWIFSGGRTVTDTERA